MSARATTMATEAALSRIAAWYGVTAYLGADVRVLRGALAELVALRAVVAAVEGLQYAWDALCYCVDEFEPEDMAACCERRDDLDTAILAVLAARQHAAPAPTREEPSAMPTALADRHTRPDAVRQALKRLRTARGLTQAQLGALLDPPVSHAAISDIERGATTLTLDYLGALCAAMGTRWTLILPLGNDERPCARG